MLKLKKFCVCIVCLVLVINLFVPLEVQAVTKDEAIDFYNDFSNAIVESKISEIRDCFENYNENEIIEIFRVSGISYPKTQSYFFIARGLQELGALEKSYEYYSKAISCINSIKNIDNEFKAIIFKCRASCLFYMMYANNKFDEKNVKKMFDDFEISLKSNANDYDTFYTLGVVYSVLGDKETELNCLARAKNLCEDYETKQEIQERIISAQKDIDKNKPGLIDGLINWGKENSSELLKFGTAVLSVIAVLSGGGGDGQ